VEGVAKYFSKQIPREWELCFGDWFDDDDDDGDRFGDDRLGGGGIGCERSGRMSGDGDRICGDRIGGDLW
jgi:hypothetical protein